MLIVPSWFPSPWVMIFSTMTLKHTFHKLNKPCWHKDQESKAHSRKIPQTISVYIYHKSEQNSTLFLHQTHQHLDSNPGPLKYKSNILFFFFAFPSYISGVHHFWVRFLRMWPFFNPTIKVVTFRLCGWCVLGVFLLLAFTCLGHEHQDLLSPCDEMHVCTD